MLFGQFILCIKDTKVSENDLLKGLKIQEELHEKGEDKKIGEILIDMGAITQKDLVEYLHLRETLNRIDFFQFLKRIDKPTKV